MKEMQYQVYRDIELLDSGIYKNYNYYILSLGTHPTAYIEIPKDNKIYKKDYSEIDLYVHGGLTYSRNFLWISEEKKLEGWFIGWDYAHYGDYLGYELMFPENLRIKEEKKWTTEEILEEVKDAISQLEVLNE